MNLLLSICIPTMNRPKYLLQAINSIIADNTSLDEVEICISNNCSESNYTEVDNLIESLSSLCKIKYIMQRSRLSLDENHHYVKKMASGDFIYFLGDDDYFLKNGIIDLINLIKTKNPDLSIFNGTLVDVNNVIIGKHFNLPSKEYKTIDDAFIDLRDKGMFGAVLVRRELLQDNDFEMLYGTSHAYGCYWLSLLRSCEHSNVKKILIPDFPCVALRVAEKNYNHIFVYFRDIPNEIAIYQKFSGSGRSQHLLDHFSEKFNKKIASTRFLCMLSYMGCDMKLISKVNPTFYYKNRLKINFCMYISATSGFYLLKNLIFFLRKFFTKIQYSISK